MKTFHGTTTLLGLGLVLLNLHPGSAQTCSDGTPGIDGNGVVCCPIGCDECAGPDCGAAGIRAGLRTGDCCGSDIKASGLYCDDTGVAPCIISPEETTCSDGTPGVEDGKGIVCCPIGCTECAGQGCPTAGDAAGLDSGVCCGGAIQAAGVFCDDSGVAPCILNPPETLCSDGTPGLEDSKGKVCCSIGCSTCAGQGCTTAGAAAGLGASDCCGGSIQDAGVYCDDSGVAPCILGSPTDPVEELCSDDKTPGVDGNGVVCCTTGCEVCAGPSCATAGDRAGLTADDCCGLRIKSSGEYCDDNGNVAPCILGSAPAPAPDMITMAPTMAIVV